MVCSWSLQGPTGMPVKGVTEFGANFASMEGKLKVGFWAFRLQGFRLNPNFGFRHGELCKSSVWNLIPEPSAGKRAHSLTV